MTEAALSAVLPGEAAEFLFRAAQALFLQPSDPPYLVGRSHRDLGASMVCR